MYNDWKCFSTNSTVLFYKEFSLEDYDVYIVLNEWPESINPVRIYMQVVYDEKVYNIHSIDEPCSNTMIKNMIEISLIGIEEYDISIIEIIYENNENLDILWEAFENQKSISRW